MDLFFRKFGEGKPLVILHGLFGQSDNWNSLAKHFSMQGFAVYTVDQRNHGLSPHSDDWDYRLMSDDLYELFTNEKLQDAVLIGHSMGGKTAMQFALDHPELLDKLIVVDISPKYYPIHHQTVLDGLNSVDFEVINTRRAAEEQLSKYIPDEGTKQFLLKNIYWKEDGKLAWRFNLPVITAKIESVGEATPVDHSCEVPALFIRGERSGYIRDEDWSLIQELFPRSMLETVADAGHWIHAEKPKEFFETVMKFIN